MMASDETTGSRILVVDDIQDNRDLMVAVLETGPWTVATAHDAASALQHGPPNEDASPGCAGVSPRGGVD